MASITLGMQGRMCELRRFTAAAHAWTVMQSQNTCKFISHIQNVAIRKAMPSRVVQKLNKNRFKTMTIIMTVCNSDLPPKSENVLVVKMVVNKQWTAGTTFYTPRLPKSKKVVTVFINS